MREIPTPEEVYKQNPDIERRLNQFLDAINESVSKGERVTEIMKFDTDAEELVVDLLRAKGWKVTTEGWTMFWTIRPT